MTTSCGDTVTLRSAPVLMHAGQAEGKISALEHLKKADKAPSDLKKHKPDPNIEKLSKEISELQATNKANGKEHARETKLLEAKLASSEAEVQSLQVKAAAAAKLEADLRHGLMVAVMKEREKAATALLHANHEHSTQMMHLLQVHSPSPHHPSSQPLPMQHQPPPVTQPPNQPPAQDPPISQAAPPAQAQPNVQHQQPNAQHQQPNAQHQQLTSPS